MVNDFIKNLYRTSPTIRKNLESVFPTIIFEKSNLLAAIARACLGQVMVKGEPDLACALNVNKIAKIALGEEIGGGASTYLMYGELLRHKRFCRVPEAGSGQIVISPTGYGDGRIKHGHVGIFLDNHLIASNDSKTGIWSPNYTLTSWINKYQKGGGFPVIFFMPL
jgi:hypothetical protein